MPSFKTLLRPHRRCGAILLATLIAVELPAATPPAAKFQKIVFGSQVRSLEEFETFATRARQSGATHVVLTSEDFPWARWQYDTPGDPYPSWIVSNHGLLKVAVPEALQGHIPAEYSNRIMQALQERSRILARLGLRGVYTSFEPQVLPESVYEAHPMWRGPQVDSPPRSRVPRFAPNIDHPAVLNLYRESVRKLLAACPQIDTFSFYTNDSGSGMSWAEGLYPGPNGSSFSEGKSMAQRYRDFFAALRSGAADSGVNGLEIHVNWDRERNRDLIVKQLEPGTALSNLEGPTGRRYKGEVGYLLDYLYPYYPAQGVPVAVRFLEELESAYFSDAPRLFVLIGDRINRDLYFSIYDDFVANPTRGYESRLKRLKAVASQRVGAAEAERLVEAWLELDKVEHDMSLMMIGGTVVYLGSVQQRWLTRPFVPFPEELTEEEKAHYRQYQFQASTEERADNLHDMQGMRYYSGLGGRLLGDRLLGRMVSGVSRAAAKFAEIERRGGNSPGVDPPTSRRLQALACLLTNCRNAIEYQYYLDVAKTWDLSRPYDLAQVKAIPEWLAIRRIARRELDNTARLIELLEGTRGELLDLAPTPDQTDIRRLEPDLTASLRKKLKIMMAHWEDHERLFMNPAIAP